VREDARARSVSWMARGACRGADPELFFPIAVRMPRWSRSFPRRRSVSRPADKRPFKGGPAWLCHNLSGLVAACVFGRNGNSYHRARK